MIVLLSLLKVWLLIDHYSRRDIEIVKVKSKWHWYVLKCIKKRHLWQQRQNNYKDDKLIADSSRKQELDGHKEGFNEINGCYYVSQMCTVNWRCLYLLFFSLLLNVKTQTRIYAIGKFHTGFAVIVTLKGNAHTAYVYWCLAYWESSSQICGFYSFSLMAICCIYSFSIVLRRLCDLSGGWLIRTTCLQFVWNSEFPLQKCLYTLLPNIL